MSIQSKFGTWAVHGSHGDDEKVKPVAPSVLPEIALLTSWVTIAADCADRASTVLPTLYATDPARAIEAIAATVAIVGASPTDRPSLIAAMGDYPRLRMDELPALPVVRELLAGEVLDGDAADPVAKVFPTTVGAPVHVPTLLGEYRTFRKGVYVVDSEGNRDDAYALLRQADDILRENSETTDKEGAPTLGAFAIIGGQDSAYPQSVTHVPDVLTWCYGKNDTIPAGEWNETRSHVRRILAKSLVAVGNGKYKGNGIYGGVRGIQGAIPTDKHDVVSYRGQHRSIEQNGTTRKISNGKRDPRRTIVAKPRKVLTGWMGTTCDATHPELLPVTFRGMTLHGWGTWQTPDKKVRKPRTARAQRQASDRLATLSDIAEQSYRLALTLNATPDEPSESATESGAATEPRPINAALRTVDGHRVSINYRSDRGYVVSVTLKGAKRQQVRCTAPQYVRAAVANRVRALL